MKIERTFDGRKVAEVLLDPSVLPYSMGDRKEVPTQSDIDLAVADTRNVFISIEDGKGLILFTPTEDPKTAEIHISFKKGFRGPRVIPIVRSAVGAAFELLGIDRVISHMEPWRRDAREVARKVGCRILSKTLIEITRDDFVKGQPCQQ